MGRMRNLAATVVLLAAVLAFPAGPAQGDPLAQCTQARLGEVRVKACSEVIAGADYTPGQKALAHRNRGLARNDAGARDEAIADFDAALRLGGDDGAAYAGRAHARLAKGESKAAIADFDVALRLQPTSVALLIARGHAHLVVDDPDRALEDFSEAIRLNPRSASAYNNRGLAYRRTGNYARAIEDYTTAIAINPLYALAYNNRGYAHEAEGRYAEAVKDYDSALLIDGGLAGAAAALRRLNAGGERREASERLVSEGKALVEMHCSGCHAVGTTGVSPNGKAPEFRSLSRRHPIQALKEPLARGIAAPHDEMPKFVLPER